MEWYDVLHYKIIINSKHLIARVESNGSTRQVAKIQSDKTNAEFYLHEHQNDQWLILLIDHTNYCTLTCCGHAHFYSSQVTNLQSQYTKSQSQVDKYQERSIKMESNLSPIMWTDDTCTIFPERSPRKSPEHHLPPHATFVVTTNTWVTITFFITRLHHQNFLGNYDTSIWKVIQTCSTAAY